MTTKDYVALAIRTESPVNDAMKDRYINPVAFTKLLLAVNDLRSLGKVLDMLNRYLSYGKEQPELTALVPVSPARGVTSTLGLAPSIVERLKDRRNIRLIHAVLGIVKESIELIDGLFLFIEGDTPELDTINMVEETGDCLWYEALLADVLQVQLDDFMGRNIRKLQRRYPDLAWSATQAVARDLDAERKALSLEAPVWQQDLQETEATALEVHIKAILAHRGVKLPDGFASYPELVSKIESFWEANALEVKRLRNSLELLADRKDEFGAISGSARAIARDILDKTNRSGEFSTGHIYLRPKRICNHTNADGKTAWVEGADSCCQLCGARD